MLSAFFRYAEMLQGWPLLPDIFCQLSTLSLMIELCLVVFDSNTRTAHWNGDSTWRTLSRWYLLALCSPSSPRSAFALLHWIGSTLQLVPLSSNVIWSERSLGKPPLELMGSKAVYRCGIVVTEKTSSLPPYVVFSNGPQMSRCRVISSALVLSLRFVKGLVCFVYKHVE